MGNLCVNDGRTHFMYIMYEYLFAFVCATYIVGAI